MGKIRMKLRRRRGESLVESVISMFVIVLGMTMLAGAIVTAARVNSTAGEYAEYFDGGKDTGRPVNVSVAALGGTEGTEPTVYVANLWEDSSGRLYSYEYTTAPEEASGP